MGLKNVRRDGLPFTLVSDGELNVYELARSGKKREWLEKEIKKRGINDIKDVFIASLDVENELFVQLKGERDKK